LHTESEQVCGFLASVPVGIIVSKRKMLRIFIKMQYITWFLKVTSMRNTILLLVLSIPVFFIVPSFITIDGPDETNKQIITAITAGNAENLSKYFNSMVDCGIMGNEDTYSKAQAARIIQDFFDKYPVKSLKITKQGTSTDGSRFSIGELDAGGKMFRLFYLLKKISDSYLIQQFQIQEEH
jgi:hypothetical protein